MTKPDWFKLTQNDEPYEPIDSYRPIGVLSLIIAIGLIGVFFLFPQKTADPCINPTVVVEPIQTPIGDK